MFVLFLQLAKFGIFAFAIRTKCRYLEEDFSAEENTDALYKSMELTACYLVLLRRTNDKSLIISWVRAFEFCKRHERLGSINQKSTQIFEAFVGCAIAVAWVVFYGARWAFDQASVRVVHPAHPLIVRGWVVGIVPGHIWIHAVRPWLLNHPCRFGNPNLIRWEKRSVYVCFCAVNKLKRHITKGTAAIKKLAAT